MKFSLKTLAVLLVMVFFITSCSVYKEDEILNTDDFLGYYMPKPSDWNWDFWIGDTIIYNDLHANYQFVNGSSTTFYGNCISDESKEYIRYRYTTCTYEKKLFEYITEIVITDPNVTVCGLSYTSDIEEWKMIFSKMEYTISTNITNEDNWVIAGTYGYFKIAVSFDKSDEPKGKITIVHTIPNVEEECS